MLFYYVTYTRVAQILVDLFPPSSTYSFWAAARVSKTQLHTIFSKCPQEMRIKPPDMLTVFKILVSHGLLHRHKGL